MFLIFYSNRALLDDQTQMQVANEQDGRHRQWMPRSAQISASSTSAVVARRITRPIRSCGFASSTAAPSAQPSVPVTSVNHNLSLEDHINLKYADNQMG
jgi:hypothetical protein